MNGLVYLTHARGAKLPRPSPPVRANVFVKPESRGDHLWLRATGLDERGHEVLRPLIKAQIEKVTEHGMVIRGTEVVARTNGSKSNAGTFPQVWWVFVLTASAMAVYEGEDPLDATADRKRAADSASGF